MNTRLNGHLPCSLSGILLVGLACLLPMASPVAQEGDAAPAAGENAPELGTVENPTESGEQASGLGLTITLLVVGFTLLFFEILLPGLVLGTLAVLCLLAAVVTGYTYTDYGHWILGLVVVGLMAAVVAFVRWFPKTTFGKQLASQSMVGSLGTEKPDLLDQTGMAFTPLRPSGTAEINNQRVNVVTEGEFIEKGTPVKVVRVEGTRVVVREQ